MINKKSREEIKLMKMAGNIVALVHQEMAKTISPGISTLELDKIAYDIIKKNKAIPTFLGYCGYPNSICASVNEVVVHGIPSKNVILKEGDIISIDVGVKINGYNGDAARTFAVGKISAEKARLINVTRECFFEGIKKLKVGAKLGEMSATIQKHAESNGYSVVRELVGHGIGKNMHEQPEVPNYGMPTQGVRVKDGMCLAIEPMINMGGRFVLLDTDGWGIITRDGKPSAHYENTVIVTPNGVEITTIYEE